MQPDKTRINVPKSDEIGIDPSLDAPRKPQKIPKTERDFKRVYRDRDKKEAEGPDDEQEKVVQKKEEPATEKKSNSIFDLAAKAEQKQSQSDTASDRESRTKKEIVPVGEEKKKEDIPTYYPHETVEAYPHETVEARRASPNEIEEKKVERQGVYGREQPDLSSVNPLSRPMEQIETAGVLKSDIPVPESKPLKELVAQLVEKMTTLKAEGKTDTIITLKHPPLFEGVQVKLSSFETAKGEFNIAFSNLTAQAKNMIDLNLNTLRLGLEQKGHILHIVTTSTQIESPKETEGGLFARRDREGSQEGGEGEQRERESQG